MVDHGQHGSAQGRITVAHDGAVSVVTLDRPSAHNALSVAMINQLTETVRGLRESPDVRAVVLTGAGDRAFSAGGDLGELIPRITGGELDILVPDSGKRFFSDLYVPVVAAVNGLCLAGGLELLLGADLRVASSTATFGLPEVKWGLIPGGGTHIRLPQQIGWPAAMQLLLTGEPIDADAALRVGLVGEVVEPQEVLPRAMELAHLIASNAPIAVRTAKEIAVKALGNESRFHLETALNELVVGSRDAREGPAAFIERRQPHYENR